MESIASTNKLYWYEILLKAIEVFSTKFNEEQLADFSLDFANEILTLNQSSLYLWDGKQYVPKKKRLYQSTLPVIADSASLQRIATFHGEVIHSHFDHFFQQEDIEQLQMKLVIPLIIDDQLFGFIVSNGKATGEFEEDDFSIANTLMKLINNSLENSRHYAALQVTNSELNKKIFNLFAINQSTKALLSEVKLENLFSIATDVFSEVSSSRVTSFGIYDDITRKIKIRGYRNVESYGQFYSEFGLARTSYHHSKLVLHIEDDRDIISSIFENWQDFQELETKYIVLIVKEKILGFVTLSDSVNNSGYDHSMFELIESLASSTYIAIANAILFEEITRQKELLERKFATVNSLNKLVRNINQCENHDELCRLALKALAFSFGITKAFFCFKVEGESRIYEVQHQIGLTLKEGFTFYLNEAWDKLDCQETKAYYSFEGASVFFEDESLMNETNSGNCLVISPLSLKKANDDVAEGYLIITETKENLKEEEVLLIDTVGQNISPILHQLFSTLELKRTHKEDQRQKLLRDLEDKIRDRSMFQLDFYLYYKKENLHPFKQIEWKETVSGLRCYRIDPYIFIISYQQLRDESLTEIVIWNSAQELLNYNFE